MKRRTTAQADMGTATPHVDRTPHFHFAQLSLRFLRHNGCVGRSDAPALWCLMAKERGGLV